jgi:hypothetical protein
MSLPRVERPQTASEPLELTDDGLRRVPLGQRPMGTCALAQTLVNALETSH